MQYFDTLPKVIYTDNNGVSKVVTNILARASVLPDILKSPLVYYQYDIQEGDTPEIIAHKYYGDVYRFWIVMFANQLLDPQWDWPMTSNQFNAYLNDKYPSTDVYNTVHHYEKTISQYDYGSNTPSSNTVTVDLDTYNAIVPQTNNFTLPTGIVSVTVNKNAVSVHDYELSLNESKRTINILNSLYVDQMETEFKKLMAS
jgi:hypothetical protein